MLKLEKPENVVLGPHFDAKAWNLEPGTWNLDFGTWNLRNLKTWSLDLALMLKPSIVTEHGQGAARSPVCAPSELSGQSKAKAGQGSQARLNQGTPTLPEHPSGHPRPKSA